MNYKQLYEDAREKWNKVNREYKEARICKCSIRCNKGICKKNKHKIISTLNIREKDFEYSDTDLGHTIDYDNIPSWKELDYYKCLYVKSMESENKI